ncbi:MAG: GIY-YIG nuclease family protein [Pseudomonadota bacterium]
MSKSGWVYMMSDRYRGGVYTGVTSELPFRIGQYKSGAGSQFVKRYGFTRLVYMGQHEEIENAIAREKAIKKWRRAWKVELIEAMNPDWADLYETLNN